MRSGQIPWSEESIIKCCKNCVPPKRHLRCHSTCEEYKRDKEKLEALKEKEQEKKKMGHRISKYDFDMVSCECKQYVSRR